ASTEYICEVQDAHNSAGAASLFAESLVLDSDLIPNVFTPNNDGVNDYYIIKETHSFNSFEVFNRWGNVVYSWDGGNVYWNGMDRKNKMLLNGVYFYKVQYKGCGDDSIKSGFIQLVR
ncbi:MAG: gliding motility-associated C-terminal domain-containing protein, partial [Crocinitomicaceae bacterium]